jgi:hypothetical protein
LAEYGNVKGDNGLRKAVKNIFTQFGGFNPIGSSVEYLTPDSTRIFIGDVPKIYETETRSAFIDKNVLGIQGGGTISVSVLTRISWFPGALRVSYTREQDAPTIIIGSGTVERTITDPQYQILHNTISGQAFNNESEVLAIMQKRAQAEYDRMHTPTISGTITILGDETVDLKSAVLIDGLHLDVVRVVHSFQSGFTTQITLTNERFTPTTFGQISRPERNVRESERNATNIFRFGFEDAAVDKNVATQRQQEFQRKAAIAGDSEAVYAG